MRGQRILLAIALVVGALALRGHSQETPVAGPPAPNAAESAAWQWPLRYHLVYVPADQIDNKARNTIPLRRDRFEEMVGAFTNDPPAVQVSRVESCMLAARLEAGEMTGLGQLSVRQANEANTYLSLAPCRLPIASAWWAEELDEVSLGYDPKGELGALIDRGGLCQFQWSLPGTTTEGSPGEYRLSLPASPLNKVLIIAPAGQQLRSSAGLLRPASAAELAPWSWWNESPRAEEAAWLLELGGLKSVVVSAVGESNSASPPLGAAYRQATRYELSVHETEVITEIYLDRPIDSLAALNVEWPQELSLVAAQWDKQNLLWKAAAHADESTRRASISLPQGVAAGGIPVLLRFIGSPMPARVQPLPKVVVNNASWREEEVLVSVVPPLELTRVEHEQSLVEPPSPTDEGEQLAFRMLADDAEIRLATGVEQSMLHGAAAALLDFDREGIRGRYYAAIESFQGTEFRLLARLGTSWTIDSVEAVGYTPPLDEARDILRDWSIVGSQGPWQTLEFRLQQPLEPGQNVRLAIVAHQRNAALEGPLVLRDLDFLTLREVGIDQQYFALRADSGWQLQLESAGSSRLVESTQELVSLLGAKAKEASLESYSLLLESQSPRPETRLSLRRAKPRYAGAVESKFRIGQQTVAADHRVVCTPQSGTVGRLAVRVASKELPPLQWDIEGDGNSSVTPTLLHEDLEGTIWELSIVPPRSKPFTLLAQRQLPRDESNRLGLVSLPDAVVESGEVVVEAAAANVSYRLQPRGLNIAPVVASRSEDRQNLLSRFRYQAGEVRQLIVLSDEAAVVAAAVEVWQFQLDSLVTPDRVRHAARYSIENRGASQFRAQLPPEVVLREVYVDGDRIALATAAAGREVQLALPAAKRFVEVRLVYDEPRSAPWSLWRRLAAKVPATQWPALERQWNLQAAPEIAVWNRANLAQLHEPLPWHAKLFGPLAGAHVPAARAQEAVPETSPGAPWRVAAAAPEASPAEAGWPVIELPLVEGEESSVTLTKPASWQILATALVLISAALSLLICRGRPVRILLILGITCALGLLAPSMCAVASSGLFLGALLAAAWLGVSKLSPRQAAIEPPGDSREASTASAATFQMMIGWLLLSAALAGSGFFDAPTTARAQEAAPKRPPIYPVFVPMNGNEETLGSYVHLHEDFYKALHRKYWDHRAPPVRWLLHSAEYACELEPYDDDVTDRASDPTTVEALRFDAEISVLRSDGNLVLPFQADQLTLVEGQSFLSGTAIEPFWSDDGKSLQIPPQATGRHRLELVFRPRTETVSGRSVLKLNAPPAVHARLEILHPGSTGRFRLEPPIPLRSASAERTVGELGPLRYWELELPSRVETSRSLAAEQLIWLQLRPDAIVWDVKFRYTPTAGSTRFVEWEVDPNLRLLTVSVEGAEYARHTRYPQRRLMNIELTGPVSEPFTVEAKFLQEEAHGIGKLGFPLLRAVGAQQDRRWLAVSCSEALEVTIDHGDTAESLPASDFLTAWGAEADPPERAFRLLAPQPRWSVTSVPSTRPATVQTQSTLALRSDATVLEFEVGVPSTERPQPLYQFKLPPRFRLDSAVLHSAEGATRLRPAVDRNHVLVVIPEPTDSPHRIVLKMHGPPAMGNYPLPEVQIDQFEVATAEYRVFRQGDLQVEFAGPASQENPLAAELINQHSTQWGRLAGVFLREGAQTQAPRPVAVVTRNDPVIEEGEMVLALFRQQGNWQLNLTIQGTVVGGQLDALRLGADERVPQPNMEYPAASLESFPLSAESRRQWVIHPSQPLSGEFALELSLPLEFEQGVPPRLPQIELMGHSLPTYVLLPRRASDQQVAWTVSNMEPALAPEPLRKDQWLPMAWESYRAGDDYSASLSLEAPQRLEPQVRLADVQIIVYEHRFFFGTAAFDLEPGGLSTCRLELPAQLTLRQVLLDGASIPVRKEPSGGEGQNRYLCLLGEANLPHRLEVLFDGQAEGSEAIQLAMPFLPDIPVERTLWTIFAPREAQLAAVDQSVRAITLQRHLEFRLQGAATLSEPPSQVIAAVAKRDLAPWFASWAERMARYYRAGRGLAGDRPPEYPFDDDFLREHGEMAARMGLTEEFHAAFEQPSNGRWQLAHIVPELGSSKHAAIYAMSQGPPQTLKLKIARGEAPAARYYLAAFGLFSLFTAGYFLLRKRSVTEWIVWWLHPLCVLLGIAWWLWLTPSVIGWVIIAIAVVGSLRSPWRMQSLDSRRSVMPRSH